MDQKQFAIKFTLSFIALVALAFAFLALSRRWFVRSRDEVTVVDHAVASPSGELVARFEKTSYGVWGGRCTVLIQDQAGHRAELASGDFSVHLRLAWVDENSLAVTLLHDSEYLCEGRDLNDRTVLVHDREVNVQFAPDNSNFIRPRTPQRGQ